MIRNSCLCFTGTFSQGEILAVRILAAKLPHSGLNFAVDFGVDFFSWFFSPNAFIPKQTLSLQGAQNVRLQLQFFSLGAAWELIYYNCNLILGGPS